MIKFKCLLCGVEWCDPQATDLDIYHGYCPRCIQYENAILSGFTRPRSGRDTMTASTKAMMTTGKTIAASEQHVQMI